jgi:hypothetical protein
VIRRGNAADFARMRMRKIFIAAFAAAAFLAAAMPLHGAAAMPPAAASALAAAGADARLVEPVVNVCGANGCVRVQTQRVVKRHIPPPPPRN